MHARACFVLSLTTDFATFFQSLLRGRFLRHERPVEDERPPSIAASELVQLRQRHTVSGLRCAYFPTHHISS